MNRIQLLSRDIETQRLKLQMGLDPTVVIDHLTVRAMWQALNAERLRAQLGDRYLATHAEPLPDDPATVDARRH